VLQRHVRQTTAGHDTYPVLEMLALMPCQGKSVAHCMLAHELAITTDHESM
jgi:hypothetical protein